MVGLRRDNPRSVLDQLAELEQALADIRLERKIALEQPGPCADLVANRAAWDREEAALLERIAKLRADLV